MRMQFVSVVANLTLLLTFSQASDPRQCTLRQRLSMKEQWGQVWVMGFGEERAEIAMKVWTRLLSVYPQVIPNHLKNVNAMDLNSREFKEFAGKTLSGFDLCMSMLEEDDVLQAQMAHLRTKHKAYMGLLPGYFTTFMDVLIDISSEIVGDAFDSVAWEACGYYIMEGIQDHDREL